MLNILVAHKPEAARIIQAFSLIRDQNRPEFNVYLGEDIRVYVTGNGQERCYSVTKNILHSGRASRPSESSHWLNFGIAGSRMYQINTVVTAESVVQSVSGKTWSMKLSNPHQESLACVHSVDVPQNDYSLPFVYEMEACGMMAALEEEGQCDRAAVIKVISDGPEYPADSLSFESIQAVLNDSSKEILSIISAYKLLSENTHALI